MVKEQLSKNDKIIPFFVPDAGYFFEAETGRSGESICELASADSRGQFNFWPLARG